MSMFADAAGWMIITAVAVLYARSNSGVPDSKASVSGPSAENEVNPLRWRHNGEQPTFHKDGNKAGHVDEHVQDLMMISNYGV